MSTTTRQPQPAPDQRSFYDSRYASGEYMSDFGDLFEACRRLTVKQQLAELDIQPRVVLDFGCGEARYFDTVAALFPAAAITGCDVSAVALRRAQEQHPGGTFLPMGGGRIPVADASVDLLLSVEVLEHVDDVAEATREIGRVLRPGGVAVISTPCANRWSLEWVMNRLRPRGLQPSPDGYGRFATDEPGHLRRLESRDLAILLAHADMTVRQFSFRAHLFTTLVALRPARIPFALRVRLAMLDWRLWRRRPNGATMLVVATKSTPA
jgi:SAM-dependent methyltransferase